jgi:hypothetical protein
LILIQVFSLFANLAGRFLLAGAVIVMVLVGGQYSAQADSPIFPVDNPPVLSSPIPRSASSDENSTSETAPVSTPAPVNLRLLIPQALSHLLVDGALDIRYRDSTTGRSDSPYIQSVELDLQQPITSSHVQQGSVFVQMIGENPPDVAQQNGVKEFAIGEAYVSYRLPILTDTDSTSYLRVGQFVLPVGLMATYDTHQEIIQSLYAEGIGERTDWGAALDGRFYGVLDYNFAVTAGDGPGHLYAVPDRVVSFRLGRLLLKKYFTINIGGSLLGGRLPITEVDPVTGFPPVLPPSGKLSASFGYENKTRIIGDAQWTYRNVTARGEAMSGSDTNDSVLGSFVEGEYRFAPGLSGVLADTFWDYGRGESTSSDIAAGLNISYSRDIVIRTVYEYQRDIPSNLTPVTADAGPDSHVRNVFTVQVLFRF